LKRLLEKPKNTSLLSLYEVFTKALTDAEEKLSQLDDRATWTWHVDEETSEAEDEESENISELEEEDEEQVFKDIFKDEVEITKIVSEDELVELKDYEQKGLIFDADPNLWTLVMVMDGKGVWRLQAQMASKIEVPVYAMTKAEVESVKKSFRERKGARVWLQTVGLTFGQEKFIFGACMTVVDKNYKWGINPKDLRPDDGLQFVNWNHDFVKSNVDSIELLGV
jgi:hypothetical protein